MEKKTTLAEMRADRITKGLDAQEVFCQGDWGSNLQETTRSGRLRGRDSTTRGACGKEGRREMLLQRGN